MPRIPEYGGPKVEERALPGVRMSTNASPDTFGAGIAKAVGGMAQGLEPLGRVAQRTWLEEQDKIKKAKDETWVAEKLSEAQKRADSLLFGDQAAGVDGFYNLKGLAAADKAKEMPEALDKAFADLQNDAPSEEAKLALSQRLMAVRRSNGSEVARHAAGELNRYRVDAQVDQAKSGMDSLLAKYTMPAQNLERDFDELVAPGITEAARLQGKQSTDLVNDARGKLYAGVIKQNLNAGNKEYGKRLMERWAGALPAEARTTLLGEVRKMELQDEGDDKAQQFLTRLEGGADESSILKDINAIEDRDLRRYTLQSYRAFSGQIKLERRLAEEASVAGAVDKVDEFAGDFIGMQKYVRGLDLNSKAGKAAHRRLSYYSQYAGVDPDTDYEKFQGLAEDAYYGKFSTAAALKSDERWTSIAAKDQKVLVNDLEKKSKVAAHEYDVAYKFAIGKDGDPKAKLDDAQKKDSMRFREWAETMVADTKRGDEPEYVKKLAATWALKGERKGGLALGYGADMTFGQAQKDPEAAKTFLPDLDAGQKAQVDAVFAANPDTRAKWTAAYGGNPDRAARAYWMEYRRTLIGKRRKEQ